MIQVTIVPLVWNVRVLNPAPGRGDMGSPQFQTGTPPGHSQPIAEPARFFTSSDAKRRGKWSVPSGRSAANKINN